MKCKLPESCWERKKKWANAFKQSHARRVKRHIRGSVEPPELTVKVEVMKHLACLSRFKTSCSIFSCLDFWSPFYLLYQYSTWSVSSKHKKDFQIKWSMLLQESTQFLAQRLEQKIWTGLLQTVSGNHFISMFLQFTFVLRIYFTWETPQNYYQSLIKIETGRLDWEPSK